MAAVATRGLTKRYGETVAVDHLDLEIEAGEVFGLLGPNGAGKTTTILMLLGLTPPTSGEAEVLGLDPTRRPLEVKRRVGYLPDSVGFYDHMTGRENLRYTARLNGLGGEAEPAIDDALAVVGLSPDADRRVSGYSRGMRQRLGMADALVKDPAVLVLDEPTVNIDPAGVEDMLAQVRRLADEGVTVVLSSHLLHQVQEVCNRIGIFVAGRMIANGSLDELARQLETRQVVEVGATGPASTVEGVLRGVGGVVDVAHEGTLWLVTCERECRAGISDALHDHGCSVSHLRARSAELDTIYRRYFRPDQGEAGDDDGSLEDAVA